jgi:hypothetical protein
MNHGGRDLNNYLNRTNKNLYLLNTFDWSTTDEVIDWNVIDDEWLDVLLREEGLEEVNEKNTLLDPYDEEYWEDIRDIFINFLKENNAYEKFDVNLKRKNKNIWTLFHKEYPMDYIGRGFDWDPTQEGSKYWRDLHYKWSEILKKMYWDKKYVNENNNIDIDPYGEEQWEDKDYKELFIKFLKDNGAYDKFVKNLNDFWKKNIDEYLNIQQPVEEYIHYEDYIVSAFSLTQTDEGAEYWWDLDDLWNYLIR